MRKMFQKCNAIVLFMALLVQPMACQALTLDEVPPYSGEPYYVVNDNVPDFTEEDLTTESFEEYSELDELGRCGTAYACVGQDLMPTEKRGDISSVKPTGWQFVQYDFINGKNCYNRCHLLGFQLTGENANKENLITGTRYLNVEMLPFENLVADYVKETDEHVLYRVTPLFDGDNLVADGVEMEAMSVEDEGDGVLFHVFCYNVQPGVVIDYSDGSTREGDPVSAAASMEKEEKDSGKETFILNAKTGKFHLPSCQYAGQIKEANRKEMSASMKKMEESGYEPCRKCLP